MHFCLRIGNFFSKPIPYNQFPHQFVLVTLLAKMKSKENILVNALLLTMVTQQKTL